MIINRFLIMKFIIFSNFKLYQSSLILHKNILLFLTKVYTQIFNNINM